MEIIKYSQDGSGTNNQMVVRDVSLLYSYEFLMCMNNKIKSMVPFYIKTENNQKKVCYKMEQMVPFDVYYNKRKLGSKEVLSCFKALLELVNECKRYLLNANQILFNPKYIMVNLREKKANFFYLFYEEESNSFIEFILFIIEHIKYDNMKFVEVIHEVYNEVSQQDSFINTDYYIAYVVEQLEKIVKDEGALADKEDEGNKEFYETRYRSERDVNEGKRSQGNRSERNISDEDRTKKSKIKERVKESDSGLKNEIGKLQLKVRFTKEKKRSIECIIALVIVLLVAIFWKPLTLLKIFFYIPMIILFIGLYIKSLIRDESRDKTRGKNRIKGLTNSKKTSEDIAEKVIEKDCETSAKLEETGEIIFPGERGELRGCNKNREKVFNFSNSEQIIGSDEELSHLYLDEKGISRMHAIIGKEDDKYYVEDINSKNGTWVNGIRLVPRQKFLLGKFDLVTFGHAEFVFE